MGRTTTACLHHTTTRHALQLVLHHQGGLQSPLLLGSNRGRTGGGSQAAVLRQLLSQRVLMWGLVRRSSMVRATHHLEGAAGACRASSRAGLLLHSTVLRRAALGLMGRPIHLETAAAAGEHVEPKCGLCGQRWA